jgi:hypothetical protein
MDDLTILTNAISTHAWGVLAGALLVVLVSAAKLPAGKAQWERLPGIARPFVPILLGIVSGVGEALSTSRAWLPALVVGIASALPAVLLAIPSPTATHPATDAKAIIP